MRLLAFLLIALCSASRLDALGDWWQTPTAILTSLSRTSTTEAQNEQSVPKPLNCFIENFKEKAITYPCILVALEFCVKLIEPIFGLVTPNPSSNKADQNFVEAALLAASAVKTQGKSRTQLAVNLRVINLPLVNACVFGSGLLFPPTLCVTRGLLKMGLPRDVNAAIIAHELGHFRHSHVMRNVLRAVMTTSIVEAAKNATNYEKRKKVLDRDIAIIARINDPEVFSRSSIKSCRHITFGLFSTVLVFTGIFLLEVVGNTLSLAFQRGQEFEADSFAGDCLGEDAMILGFQALHGVPPYLIHLQWKLGRILPWDWLVKFKLVKTSKSNWMDLWTGSSTHPNTERRVRHLEDRKKIKSLGGVEGQLATYRSGTGKLTF